MADGIIEVRDLAKTYGELRAVDGVSFSVPAGGIFAFLGPNGAGKTTTIKMLTTILRPSSGSIRVDGFDPVTQQHEVRRRFGIVFQDPSVDKDLTALENMELHGVLYKMPGALRRERTEALLKFVELWERRKQPVSQFSGGMVRRLEIARALLHNPRIIFLDEPTLGLDPQTRNGIWEFIRQLSRTQGTTVFFTTHYMEEADKVADDVAVIDRGRIVAQDAPAALKALTKAATLEDAFITLTGHAIRDEQASSGLDAMRTMRKLWGR